MPLKVISSMATRQLLSELAAEFGKTQQAAIESVGGVDAARRVQAGEAFDVVILASNVIDQLMSEGRLVKGTRVNIVKSDIAVVVKAGAARPDISTEDGLKRAVSNAKTVGYSTGPSGTHLVGLFERWGIEPNLVQAKPGNPVGLLVAKGEVELGFQQLSELMHLPGVDILGPLPRGTECTTTFAGGVAATSTQPDAAREWLSLLASPAAEKAKRRNGMEPA
jgi:molybdate transport system substrate-binding protein